MGKRFHIFAPWMLALANFVPALYGQTPPDASQEADSSAAKSDKDRLPKWIRIEGIIRGRWEDTLTAAPNTMDSYYLNRMRLDILVKPASWLKFFVEGQDTRVVGYDTGRPPGSFKDPIDLRQAFIEVDGGGEKRGEMVRVGRQEVVFGTGRIFSAGDWSNSARSFDLIRGAYFVPGVRLDFVAGSVVLADSGRFDRSRSGEHVYGVYTAFDKLVSGASIEPYMFSRTQSAVTSATGRPGASDLFSLGTRIAGKAPGRIDYSFELLRQWGSYSIDRVSALGGTYTLGWTINMSDWKPRISADYSHASGGDASNGGVRRTFDQMYGTFQPFSSLTGLIGWRNTRSGRVGADVSVTTRLKVLADYRDFYLATVQDALYNSSGTPIFLNRGATSSHVGQGVDVQVAFHWPKNLMTSVGLGTLFRGEYLHESSGRATYLYPYFMWSKQF